MNWKERPEIIGENNISDGVEIAGNNVTSKYGYYGKAVAWDVGDVHMKLSLIHISEPTRRS